jgi:predicted metal-dependent phosphoesterase TrpH
MPPRIGRQCIANAARQDLQWRTIYNRSVIKCELHAHTDGDPSDRIAHGLRELVDHAAKLGYGAIAITLHDRYVDPAADAGYARERGVVLLAGIERTIRGKHVLLVNFPAACATVTGFDDLAKLKASHPQGLVVAPHPYYPTPSALGARLMNEHAALIDAVEVNAMHTRAVDFNRRAIAWARARGKPLVGNSDLHLLAQMGSTYSMVDAPPDPDAICAAIRAGRVTVHASPLSSIRAVRLFSLMCLGGLHGRLGRR